MKPSYNLPTSVRQYIVPEVILINAFIIILSSPLQREIFICYMWKKYLYKLNKYNIIK